MSGRTAESYDEAILLAEAAIDARIDCTRVFDWPCYVSIERKQAVALLRTLEGQGINLPRVRKEDASPTLMIGPRKRS